MSKVLSGIVLLGIVLSLFLVVLIFSSKSFRSDVHKYFAATIISLNALLAYTCFEAYVPPNGAMEVISWDFLFPFAFMMYVLKAIKHPLGNSKKIWLLALPWIVLSLLQAVVFFFDFDLFYWLADGDEETIASLIEIRSFSFLPFAIVLIGYAYAKVSAAANIYPEEKRWLAFNSLAMLVFLGSWLFSDPIASFFDFAIWPYLLALLGIFLIVTTYMGVHQLNISEQRRHLKNLQQQGFSTPNRKPLTLAEGQNEHSGLSQKTAEKIHRLHDLMSNHRLYSNPDLTRAIVAQALGISEGYLSELIKAGLKTSFNDYINELRVKEVVGMFHDENFELFSIEAIGFEAGFKSKSVFYNAFKKVTQKTPGAYRKALNLS